MKNEQMTGINVRNNLGQIISNTYNYGYVDVEKEKMASIDIKALYEKKAAIGMLPRIIVTFISFFADLTAIYFTFHPNVNNEKMLGEYFLTQLGNSGNRYIAVNSFFVLLLITATLLMITYFLAYSTFHLLTATRFGSLRRDGLEVFRVAAHRCPLCNTKLKLEYSDGNYLACKQSPKEHRWHVSFLVNSTAGKKY